MNGLHPIAMPKPIRTSAPKIASVHVARVGGGFHVQHNMTGGAAPKQYVFQDPKKMLQHINKIGSNAWREPGHNDGPAMTRTMDLNT